MRGYYPEGHQGCCTLLSHIKILNTSYILSVEQENPATWFAPAKSRHDSRSVATSEWSECMDTESGQIFFYNNTTGKCQWEKPDDYGGEITGPDEFVQNASCSKSFMVAQAQNSNDNRQVWEDAYK